jgi:hypothetical protein
MKIQSLIVISAGVISAIAIFTLSVMLRICIDEKTGKQDYKQTLQLSLAAGFAAAIVVGGLYGGAW